VARSESQIDAPWRRYWGKASRDDSRSCHLLAYHCLDVAAVAEAWLEKDRPLLDAFVRSSGAEADCLRPWLLFFLALHDLGKMDVRFQLKEPGVAGTLNPRLRGHPSLRESIGFPHGQAGYKWFFIEMGMYH